MPKVTNKTKRGIPLGGYRVLPDSSNVLDPTGVMVKGLPFAVAMSNGARRLADIGDLVIEGYIGKIAKQPPKEPEPDKPDRSKKGEKNPDTKGERDEAGKESSGSGKSKKKS